MPKVPRFLFSCALIGTLIAGFALPSAAQRAPDPPVVRHKIDGRLRISNRAAINMRVRLIRGDQRRPIAETFTRSGGEFEFAYVPEGEYFVETLESKELEATSTVVLIRPFPRERPSTVHVDIDIPEKAHPDRVKPGVVMADVDLKVPKEALKHYNNGMTAMSQNRFELGVEEFRRAIKVYPEYYAARIELGRELRLQKRYAEAEEILAPLRQIAPQRAESWIEHGIVLLQLNRRQEAILDLRHATELEPANWAAHFYLGWALLEEGPDEAESQLKRAIELDEKMAARAHLALARIADSRNQRQLAIEHLEAYLGLQPDAADAEMTRQLAERLRKSEHKEKTSP
jgi:Flp pilus assembly protein TadD